MIDKEINMNPDLRAMDELKEQWNETLRAVTINFCPEVDLSQQETLERAPYLLEERTFANRPRDKQDQFIVITAPSGVGKGTVGKLLVKNGLESMPRVNDRGMRPGEDPAAYHFVTKEEYTTMLEAGEILCPTDSGSNRAGIEKKIFLDAISSNSPFYIDSGAGTAKQIKQLPKFSQYTFSVVFILPPSFDEMYNRINKRRTEEQALLQQGGATGSVMDEAEMQKRIGIAIKHLSESVHTTDLFVVNDKVERAADKLLALVETKTN